MYKVGDRVELRYYAPNFNGMVGTVIRVNGWCIYVKLDEHPAEVEVYPNEIVKLE